jgi:hypothetical protein
MNYVTRRFDNCEGEHSGVTPIMTSPLALPALAKAVVNFERHGPPLGEDDPWHVFMLMMLLSEKNEFRVRGCR